MKIAYSVYLKCALLTLLAGTVFMKAEAQTSFGVNANPGVNLFMVPGTITVGQTAVLKIYVFNGGPDYEDSIVANSLRVQVTSGLNAENLGFATPNPRWSIVSLPAGAGNTISLLNTTTIQPLFDDVDSILLTVKGVSGSLPPQPFTANLSYVVGVNPLIGRPSAAQGDLSLVDNSSMVELIVNPNPLPVALASFTATAAPGKCTAQLQWTTNEEKNFDHFAVQYSADGNKFETAGNVKSNGNPLGSTYNYSMEQSAAKTYYRLQMIDKDGSVNYSKTVPVITHCDNNGTSVTWSVYPNPAQTGATAYLQYNGSKTQTINAIITDATGKQIWTTDLKAAAGKNVFSIPSAGWTPGTYFVNLYDENGAMINATQKLVLN